MLFIARSIKGSEFMYSTKELYEVPKSSAKKICDVLNSNSYHLNDGETWYVHEGYEWDTPINGKAKMYKGNVRITKERW
jgi:hypothetical protein